MLWRLSWRLNAGCGCPASDGEMGVTADHITTPICHNTNLGTHRTMQSTRMRYSGSEMVTYLLMDLLLAARASSHMPGAETPPDFDWWLPHVPSDAQFGDGLVTPIQTGAPVGLDSFICKQNHNDDEVKHGTPEHVYVSVNSTASPTIPDRHQPWTAWWFDQLPVPWLVASMPGSGWLWNACNRTSYICRTAILLKNVIHKILTGLCNIKNFPLSCCLWHWHLTLWLPNNIFRNCHLVPNKFFRFSSLVPNKIFGFSLLVPDQIWPSTFPPTTDRMILFSE